MINKRISIIIPAYNEERHLAACLDAIARQTVQPWEVLVVDNNSIDRTVEIARSYSFVRVLTAHEQGVVFARNTGFDAARGDILARIDADTQLFPDWLQRITDFYQDAAYSDSALTGTALCYNVRLPRFVSWVQGQIAFRLNRFLLGHYILFGTNMALPTSLWRAVREDVCLRTDIHEDLDLSIHLHRRGYHIAYRATLQVGAKMRRVRSNQAALWENLQWWPKTLRVHGRKGWPLSSLGAVLLWLGSPVFTVAEYLARVCGKKPLAD